MPAARTKRRQTHANVAHTIRQRIRSGTWPPGHMLPGRRALTKELGAALTTVERAVATLIAEGLLRADDRRGTFVTDSAGPAVAFIAPTASGPSCDSTIALIGTVVPYQSESMRSEQWDARIMAGCEYALAGVRGLRQHVVNRVRAGGGLLEPDELTAQLDDDIDAVVLVGSHEGETTRLLELGLPMVQVLLDPGDGRTPEVCVDGRTGGALALRHLLESGYRAPRYLLPFATDWSLTRRDGAATEAGPEGLAVIAATDLTQPTDRLSIRQQVELAGPLIEHALDRGIDPGTGIIAPNDAIGEAFIIAAGHRGLRAGIDYGIVGFDDRRRELGLTSLRPPLEELGAAAADLLLRLLRGETCPARIALAHRLVPRQSTRPWGLAARAG